MLEILGIIGILYIAYWILVILLSAAVITGIPLFIKFMWDQFIANFWGDWHEQLFGLVLFVVSMLFLWAIIVGVILPIRERFSHENKGEVSY
jgi:hypothetical protein